MQSRMADVLLPAENGGHAILGSAAPIEDEEMITAKSKLGKSPQKTAAEVYQDDLKVPEEFVISHPAKCPNGCWGEDESKSNFEFPLIDVAPLIKFFAGKQEPSEEESARQVIEAIGKASETWGFFKVSNHGIPVELLDKVVNVAREFLELPQQEKEKCAPRSGEFEGYGVNSFAGSFIKAPPAGLPSQSEVELWGYALRHIVKPISASSPMPLKPEAYRPLMGEYTQALETIILCIWRALSVYLGLAPDTLMKGQERDDDETRLIFRVNYYPKSSVPEKVVGLNEHKDFGSFTLLLQDEVVGLQVQMPGTAEWLDVPANTGANKGTLLVNIANQVEIMSNGRFRSAMHRALVPKNSSRLSIAAFVTPGPTCVISPLPEVLEKTGAPPRYLPCLFGDYIVNFATDLAAGVAPYARYEINRE